MTMFRSRMLARVVAPVSEPLTLSEAKLYLRVDHGNEDVLINDLIVAARMTAEHWLKRSLMTQSWKLAYDDCVPEEVYLPMGPVNSVSSVAIVDSEGGTDTLDSDHYTLSANKDVLAFDTVPSGFRIEIVYATGYGDATAVPRPIKLGMLSHIAAMYDGRGEGGAALPAQSAGLYMPFREVCL